MWHRIVDNQIVESIPSFGDEWMQALSPGELYERFGWVQGTPLPQPVYDPDDYKLVCVPMYQRMTGTVLEAWNVVPIAPEDPVYIDTPSRADRRAARKYADLVTMLAMTPQEVATLVDTAFASSTAQQRRILRAMAVVVRVLAARRNLL